MKLKYLCWILLIPLLSGCGVSKTTRQFYTPTSQSVGDNINIRAVLQGTTQPTESKRILLLYWSDLYSGPYELRFSVRVNEEPSGPLTIHSIKLYSDASIVFESDPEKSIQIPFSKRYPNADFSNNLGDRLHFKEWQELTLSVDWEIPGTCKRQWFVGKIMGMESKETCSILTAVAASMN